MPVLISILFGALLTLATAWMLGNVCLHRLPVPWTIALGVGAAVESTVVFLLLVCGLGYRAGFALLAVAAAALYWRLGRAAPRLTDPAKARADRVSAYVAGAALACYGALYLINALAPELEPDARAYHLGLTAEYVRLAGFPARVGFYEMLPQGFEMLFVPAFAFGQHVAARLVHCAFLLSSVPLMLGIGRRLELPDGVALAAAALYFCAPVAGITGTSGYTDAGGVFFTLATFYLLLVWRDTRDVRYLAPAGITAGFCHAIKFPGALVAILAVLFVVIVERGIRVRHLLLLTGTALAMAAPWVVRSAAMTGNPAAPLFSGLFPNSYFHVSTERELAASLGSLWGVPPWRVPYELITGGTFGGTLGPVFFALPLGLWALRRRAGRICWMAAALLALPWFWNTGTRFLMPALPFLALALAIALAMALPRPALWACVAVQAVLSWPQVFALYHPGYAWRLERIPWRAALHIQSDRDYLESILPAYRVARLIEDHTEPGARIFSLISVPTAYTDREVLEYWHSAQADRLSDALRAAAQNETLCDVRAEWTPRELSGLRIRIPRASPVEWAISEITLLSGEHAVVNSPGWQLDAWPEAWDVPLAFDGNLATRWRTREPVRAGMYVEADFDRPLALSGLLMTTPTGAGSVTFEFYGLQRASWQLLTSHTLVTQKPPQDLRMAATRAFRSAGFRYILADYGNQGNALLGAAMRGHEAEWGLEKPVEVGPLLLFRIE
ncbi:MAG TPA: glycosyltransferase family 39 protein [Bryobacteraceae bacterium]|nr:glycosyltransferase family 39 protein [Bryobacteraceae bacterium]